MAAGYLASCRRGDDFFEHRLKPRQLCLQWPMEALLDVCDEIGEGRLRPVGRRLLRRQCRVELCNQGVCLKAMASADILERQSLPPQQKSMRWRWKTLMVAGYAAAMSATSVEVVIVSGAGCVFMVRPE